MQQTEKYGFNLIEGGDNFSPAPLNENMEMVEEALSAETNRVNAELAQLRAASIAPVLRQATLQSAVAKYSLNVQDLNLAQYHYLWLDVTLPEGQSAACLFTLTANGQSSGYTCNAPTSSYSVSSMGTYAITATTPQRLIFLIQREKNRRVLVQSQSSHMIYQSDIISVNELKTIDFNGYDGKTLLAGITIRLQGVR